MQPQRHELEYIQAFGIVLGTLHEPVPASLGGEPCGWSETGPETGDTRVCLLQQQKERQSEL